MLAASRLCTFFVTDALGDSGLGFLRKLVLRLIAEMALVDVILGFGFRHYNETVSVVALHLYAPDRLRVVIEDIETLFRGRQRRDEGSRRSTHTGVERSQLVAHKYSP